jgi:hypothetical protein
MVMRACLICAVLGAIVIRADLVECSNGDRYNGKVLLVDEQNVKLTNEITGLLTIPRVKVAAITFGVSKAAPITASALKTNSFSPDQPLKIDPKAVEQVQNQLLGDATPEATQMFQDMVRGLLSGKLDAGDVRNKAQSTLDQLKDLQKDLGDDDATLLLNSYASILQNFINQTPASTNKPAATIASPSQKE